MLPIVMGAHPEDYRRSAPPNSYIHVDDFESPAKLAEYLHRLDKDDDLYNSYFLWKGSGELINTKFWCRLCSMVNVAPDYPMWYEDVNDFWRGKGVCINKARPWATWRNAKTHSTSYFSQIKYGYKRQEEME